VTWCPPHRSTSLNGAFSPKGWDGLMRGRGLPRYILNRTWFGLRVVVHDRENLTERCNTDQIKRRSEARELDPSWKKCRWCFGS